MSRLEDCLWECRGAASLRASGGAGGKRQFNVEASARACVADHALAFDLNTAQDRVEVAIGRGGDQFQAIARGLAPGPQLMAGARPAILWKSISTVIRFVLLRKIRTPLKFCQRGRRV